MSTVTRFSESIPIDLKISFIGLLFPIMEPLWCDGCSMERISFSFDMESLMALFTEASSSSTSIGLVIYSHAPSFIALTVVSISW